MLEKKYKSRLDAEADRYIEYAVEGAVRMKALIQDLLAYSRIGAQRKPLKPVNCEQLLDKTVNNLRSAIVETGATITRGPLPTVLADDSQLLQVLQNLIQNAIKFRKDDPPRIHVSASKVKNDWIFSVKDNGIGIESDYFDRIFVIFQRLHKRSRYAGTGMGLAIVNDTGQGVRSCFLTSFFPARLSSSPWSNGVRHQQRYPAENSHAAEKPARLPTPVWAH